MAQKNYLRWIAEETPTAWWHDSADPAEQERALANGAVGVTTNPVLTARTLTADPGLWVPRLPGGWRELEGPQRAEALTGAVARSAARLFAPVHRDTGGAHGYVCAQVDPAAAAERETMLAMARRYHAWAANIAVKLPVTAAGLDVLEECVAEGITVTATISFTVPQVLAAAERHRAGAARARAAGIEPGRCFAVIMIGRHRRLRAGRGPRPQGPARGAGARPGGAGDLEAGPPPLPGAGLRGEADGGGHAQRAPRDRAGGRGPGAVDPPQIPGPAAGRRTSPWSGGSTGRWTRR